MRYKFAIGLICICTIFCLTYTCIADDKNVSPSHPTIIAIMDVSSGEGKLSDIISLMTVKFSQNTSIKLVERQEIDKAIKELELSASQIVNRENTLKLGHMVRADGLVFLSLSDDGKIFRVRLVDTKYGLRLLDTLVEWKEEDINKIVDEIVPRVTAVIPKLLIPPEKEILIGILGIRNVDPSSTLNWLELTLPKLISSRLTQEPSIIVLEREDLNVVLEEKLFTRGEESNFHGSMILLEGEVKQVSTKEEDSHRFIISLQTKQSNDGSKERFEVEGDTEKLVLVVEESTRWIVGEVVKSTSEGTWDTKAEAEEFFKEAKVLMAHEDWLAARPLLETAHALEPENAEIVKSLLYLIKQIAIFNGSKIFPLERAQMLRYYIDILNFQFHRGMHTGDILSDLYHVWEYLNSDSSIHTKEIKDFNRQTRQYCRSVSEQVYSSWKIEHKSWVCWGQYPFSWASAVSETPEEAMGRIKESIPGILRRPRKDEFLCFAGDPEETWIENLTHCLVIYHSTHIIESHHLDKREVIELWINLLEDITKMDDPIVKLMAELGIAKSLDLIAKKEKGFDSKMRSHCENAVNILLKELNYPNEPMSLKCRERIRSCIYYTWKNALGAEWSGWSQDAQISLPELKVKIIFDINDYMPGLKLKEQIHFHPCYTATIEDNVFYIPFLFSCEPPVGTRIVSLVGIDLAKKNLHTFWYGNLPKPEDYYLWLGDSRPMIGKDVSFLGISGVGIVKFPGAKNKGIGLLDNLEVITKKDGLPSNDISSVACIGNKLYVGLGGPFGRRESGFGVYDLEKQKWRTIASSRSKDSSYPLNIGHAYTISSLIPSSDGRKLFFVLQEYPQMLESTGLWKMEVESERFECIWKRTLFHNVISEERKMWLLGVAHSLISFDADRETGEVIFSERDVDWIMPATPDRKSPSKEKMCIPEIPGDINYSDGRSGGLFKDAYWGITWSNAKKVPFCAFVGQPLSKVRKFSISNFDSDEITWLCPTQYGVVIIGKNKIGLIEENPEH